MIEIKNGNVYEYQIGKNLYKCKVFMFDEREVYDLGIGKEFENRILNSKTLAYSRTTTEHLGKHLH